MIERRSWAYSLISWLRAKDELRTPRFKLLIEKVDQNLGAGTFRERFSYFTKLGSAVRFLAEAGIPQQSSLFREAADRILSRIIPSTGITGDAYDFIRNMIPIKKDIEWLERIPQDLVNEFGGLCKIRREDIVTAILVIAHRVSGTALAPWMLRLQPNLDAQSRPFLELPDVVKSCIGEPGSEENIRQWQSCNSRCRATLVELEVLLEAKGVSTEIVFQMELIVALLNRIDVLLNLLAEKVTVRQVVSQLIQGVVEDRSVFSLLKTKVKRLARKMVDHTGHTGEHYVSWNRAEYLAMMLAGTGGGLITAFTAFNKYYLASLQLAPGMIGIIHSLNYTSSFLLIHFLGFSLASKMPALTAAAIARAMERQDPLQKKMDLIGGIIRAQFVATVSNVFLAIPTALILDQLYKWRSGSSLLDIETAHHGIESMYPIVSGTFFFAMFTGVLLWLSSVVSGWASNWSARRSLPDAIRESRRFLSVLGKGLTDRLAKQVEHHIGGVAGYIALGFFLGFIPLLLLFLGIPLEVRHVTLSAASVALATSALYAEGHVQWLPILWAGIGVIVTGFMNITVSFALAYRVAIHARDLDPFERRTIGKEVVKLVFRSPFRLLLPPPKTTS